MNEPLSADMLARIARYEWYQRIPIGDAYRTPGEDAFTEQKLSLLEFPADLTGRSVLDIGCSEGFFAREAERRGADRLVGIDTANQLAEKVALVNEITGSKFDFRDNTVYDLSADKFGRFDLVIFLSVFQHLDHPYKALDLIAEVTEVTAIMEIPVAVAVDNDAEFQRDGYAITRRSPKGRRIFLPNEPMLFEMLLDAGFSTIERLTRHRPREVPGYGGRYKQERLILHAQKSDARLS